VPELCRGEVEPGAIVGDLEPQESVPTADRDHHVSTFPGVLAGVLDGLEAAEVERRLDVGLVAAYVAAHGGRQTGSVRHRVKRLDQPSVAQQRGVDPVGKLAQLVERFLHVAAQAVQDLAALVRVGVEQRLHQPDLDRQGDEVLLGAVVQVALDPPPRLVGGGHDPLPRGDQLGVALLELLEARLERRVEAHIVQGEADLASKIHERVVLVVGVRLVAAGNDDHPEQLTEVGHHHAPNDAIVAPGHQLRDPELEPGVALGASPCRHSQRLAVEDDLAFGLRGHRDRQSEASGTRSVGATHHPARVDLGRVEVHRLAQDLGELEQQFVHRDRARHPPTERAQGLVGRVPFAVHAQVGRLLQAAPGRHGEERGDGRGRDRQPQQGPLVRLGRAAQPDDPDDVHGGHDQHQPGVDDRRHEHTANSADQHRDPPEGERDRDHHDPRREPGKPHTGPVDQHVGGDAE